MIQEIGEETREAREETMTLDMKETILMKAQGGRTEEEMVGGTTILADLQLATGTHEIFARRFHTLGNLQ